MNHFYLISSVIVASTIIGLFLKITRGKLTNKYSKKMLFSELGIEIERGNQATILQFKTEYCSICPGVNKQIKELLKDTSGITFHELDAVEYLSLAKKLHVKSSPTIIFFDHEGLEEGRIIGAPKKNELRNTLEKITTLQKEHK